MEQQESFQAQIKLISQLVKMSQEMLDLLRQDDFDSFYAKLQNRDRLIQAIEKRDREIEQTSKKNSDDYDIYQQNCAQLIESYQLIDEEILKSLKSLQQQVQTDIRSTKINKQAVKGYNLNDVK